MGESERRGLAVRQAEPADREEMMDVLGRAFAGPDGRQSDFWTIHPQLFTDERMGDHLLCVEDRRIVGCVGLYPYDVRVRGLLMRAAGLGQVGTLPEHRGRGVMSTLLRAACEQADAQQYAFVWLGGDRLRYGRYGWATGGARMRFGFRKRYLPDPPPESAVRPLDAAGDSGLLMRYAAADTDTVVAVERELAPVLSAEGAGGWVLRESLVAYRRGVTNVYLGYGQPDEVLALLAHHLRWVVAREEGHEGISVECPVAPSTLMDVCVRNYEGVSLVPSGMFRTGPLARFLKVACRVAQPQVEAGSGRVALCNAETGETATVVCRDGELSVEQGGGDAFALNRRDLSEVCFGLCPLDVLLPGLPAGSFLRRVLPLPVYWSRFFGV